MRSEKRLRETMDRLGIEQKDGVSFGRPTIEGIACHVIRERFVAGDSIRHLAADYYLTEPEIANAIRFCILYPQSDLESFWRGRG